MMLNVSGTENVHNHLQNGAVGPRKRQTNIERAIYLTSMGIVWQSTYRLFLHTNCHWRSTHDMTSDHFS